MQLASSDEEFNVIQQLFVEKYQTVEPNFITYFKNTWLGDLKNWYEGAHMYHPSNNNGLEGANGALKAWQFRSNCH